MSTATEDSNGPAAVPKRGRPRRQYRCVHCAKIFKRSEHCIRHERIHTNEKPFACRYCQKTYSRKDLVTRHERTLHPRPGQAAKQINANIGSAPSSPPAIALDTPPTDNDDGQSIDDPNGNQESLVHTRHPGDYGFPDVVPDTNPEPPPPLFLDALATKSPELFETRNISSTSLDISWTDFPPEPNPIATASANQQDQQQPSGGQANNTPQVESNMDMLLDAVCSAAEANPGDAMHSQDAQSRRSQRQATSLFSSAIPPEIDLTSFTFSPNTSQLLGFAQDHHQNLAHDIEHFDLPDPWSIGIGPLSQPPYQIPQMNVDLHDGRSSHSESSKSSQAMSDVPILLRDGLRSFPTFKICSKVHSSIKSDLARRVASERADRDMPGVKECEEFLASYVSNFHGHLPIIHLPTFSPDREPSPLILTMCSIGALYRLHRRRAHKLHRVAREAIDTMDMRSEEEQPSLLKDYPLWLVQARVLLDFFAVMSGEASLMSSVMRHNGFYTVVYQKARARLREHHGDTFRLSWTNWAYFESWKRLMGAMLISSTMSMVMYDVNPGMNATVDLEFESFHDEKLWSARSTTEWRDVLAHIGGPGKSHPQRTMKDILADIMLHGKPDVSPGVYQVSAYSALVLMHALVVHMWQRAQVTHVFAGISLGSVATQEALSHLLIRTGLQTLSRCQFFLDNARNDFGPGPTLRYGDENTTDDTDAEKEASLVFNSQAILRIAYTRLFKDGSLRNSVDLSALQDSENDASIISFVDSKIQRSIEVVEGVAKALEGLKAPIKMGHLLVRKTAAFRWSVEQAIAGWDSALLVSKWVHTLEMDQVSGKKATPDEEELLRDIKELLEEAECEVETNSSLAAAVARTWGWLLRDVWIWGITPLMGTALDRMADAYARALSMKSSMPFSGLGSGQ